MEKSQFFGITETGDPSFNLDIFDRLYEGNIIITKRLTDKLIEKLIQHKSKIILHLSCTGFGKTKVEPFVPSLEETFIKFNTLIDNGFPIEQVVLRIDPVIPTDKGINVAKTVLDTFKESGIKRIRFSVLDMYKHVKERFTENGFPIPYNTFHAPFEIRQKIYEMFKNYGEEHSLEIEVCAEPGFESISCLSQKDVDILGLSDKIKLIGSAEQRKNCGCPSNKHELIKNGFKKTCGNKCVYCYIKTKNE